MIRRGETNKGLTGKKRTLEDLFRPPLDIMHKGTLNTVSFDLQAHIMGDDGGERAIVSNIISILGFDKMNFHTCQPLFFKRSYSFFWVF